MRVTIASRIFTPEPSAASFILRALTDELVERGHDVTVVTTRAPRSVRAADNSTTRVRRWPVLRDRNGYVRGYLPYLSFDIPLAFRLMFARRADVYVIEPPPTTGAVSRVITFLLGRPYVYDAADVWADAASATTNSRIVLSLLRSVELFALRGAAAAVTISQGVSTRLTELGITIPVTVAGFGADTTIFDYAPDPTPAGARYFVYPGSYSEWHGADILIDAFALFSQHRPGYRLIFIGNGSDQATLDARLEETGVSGVEFRDPVAGNELVPVLAGAVASLASLKPAVGYDYAFTSKVYASMAVGCPVIFTGPGPTATFIEDAEQTQRSGLAVPYDVEQVAAALESFASSPLDDFARRALSDWTRQNHSITAVARRFAEVVIATGMR